MLLVVQVILIGRLYRRGVDVGIGIGMRLARSLVKANHLRPAHLPPRRGCRRARGSRRLVVRKSFTVPGPRVTKIVGTHHDRSRSLASIPGGSKTRVVSVSDHFVAKRIPCADRIEADAVVGQLERLHGMLVREL